MKKNLQRNLFGTLLLAFFLLTSCHSAYNVTKTEGKMVSIDSTWDAKPVGEAIAMITPYKAKIDSVMYRVVGTAEMTMDRGLPESLLSNLVADLLKQSATQVLGKPADMGLVNVGGLRNVLTEGPITTGNLFEILPFENSLCVLTISGANLKHLFENIAAQHGQGVSGVRLVITKSGKLAECTVGGQPLDEQKLYTVATIDYVADGNDGMPALLQAEKRVCPQGATLRNIFMNYVESQTAADKKITSSLDGRITVQN